jgi:hypothetical protein
MNQKEILNRLIGNKEKYEIRVNRLIEKHSKIGYWRLGIFLAGVTAFFIVFFTLPGYFLYITIVLFALLFGGISNILSRYEMGIRKSKAWLNLINENIARVKIDWSGIPVKDYHFKRDHPFETDISVTGEYSLLRLVDTTVVKESGELLRGWLTNYPDEIIEIKKRQELVRDLTELDHFRNKLRIAGGLSSGKSVNGEKLIKWLKEGVYTEQIKRILILLFILIPINILLIILNIAGAMPAYWTFTTIGIVGVYFFNRHYIQSLFEETMKVEEEVGKLSGVLGYLERYRFNNKPNLQELTKEFTSDGARASVYFKKLRRVITAISFQKNPLTFFLFNALFPYDFYVAYNFSKLRESISIKLKGWLEVWYKLEALTALANFGYINDSYKFPEIIEDDATPVFEGKDLGHPLIIPGMRVTNSFMIDKEGKGIIITGSNMSGKSTFLKTIGLNCALAYAGSPAAVSNLKLRRFRLFTCINIIDSVTDGISYFYAEVKRLKKLKDEIERESDMPVLYLIDEIFRGTNNRERLVGSRSYLKSLAGTNSCGLISTHDLELVNLEEEIEEIENYHFREEVEGGKLSFDYKIKRGPCPTTNALKIMELEGLKVE